MCCPGVEGLWGLTCARRTCAASIVCWLDSLLNWSCSLKQKTWLVTRSNGFLSPVWYGSFLCVCPDWRRAVWLFSVFVPRLAVCSLTAVPGSVVCNCVPDTLCIYTSTVMACCLFNKQSQHMNCDYVGQSGVPFLLLKHDIRAATATNVMDGGTCRYSCQLWHKCTAETLHSARARQTNVPSWSHSQKPDRVARKKN